MKLLRADNSRYANGNDLRLNNLAPNALFSNFKLTTSLENHLKDNSQAYVVSLLYELISSAEHSDDLSLVLIVTVIEENKS